MQKLHRERVPRCVFCRMEPCILWLTGFKRDYTASSILNLYLNSTIYVRPRPRTKDIGYPKPGLKVHSSLVCYAKQNRAPLTRNIFQTGSSISQECTSQHSQTYHLTISRPMKMKTFIPTCIVNMEICRSTLLHVDAFHSKWVTQCVCLNVWTLSNINL